MLPFVLPDIWGTCYQRLLAALSKCISPAARHSADRQRDVPMAPADTAAAQFTRMLCCQGRPASVTLLLTCVPTLEERREDNCPCCPPPCQLFLCLLKGGGRKKDKKGQNIYKINKLEKKKKKKKENERKKLGMRERRVEEKKTCFILFVCPATTLSSAVLAEIAFSALAFPVLLYCRRMIRIIYRVVARLSPSVRNVLPSIFRLFI